MLQFVVVGQLKRKQKVLRDIYPMPHWCLDVSGPLMMEARFEALKLQVHENPSLRRSVSRLPSDSGYWEVHLDQVFQPSTDDVGVVLITGETGTGKSTHCQHYAYKWAMSRIRNHFVVYIPLKRVSQCQSIGDMIEYLYDVRSDELLSYKGVIVLDGKDEVANFSPTILEEIDSASLLTQPVPDSELKVQKHKHKVIITSRPYTDKMRQLTNVIDARLSLYGIKENAYVTFTAEMFKKEKYEEYASYIRAQFEKCQFHNRFSDILNVPIYLTMFCFVFHSELSASKDIQGEKLSQLQSITKLVNRFMEMSMDKSGQRDGRHNIWIVNHPLTSQSCYSPRLRDSIKGLSKLCFEAVLTDNFMFSNQMFKKYDVDLKEIKQLGVLLSEEQLTIDSNTSSYIKEMSEVSVDDRIEYYMRHIMFVEYFAGVYVADYCDYNLKLPQEIDQLLQPYMRLSHCVKNIENVVLFAAGMSSKFMVELLHNACIDKRCCLMGREDHDTYLTEFHSVFLQECIVCHSQQVELVHSTFCEFVRESPISNMLLLSGLSPRESSLYPVIPLAQPIAHYDIKYFMERYFSIIAEFSTTIMESPRENDRPIVMFYGTKSTNIHHLSLGPFLGAMLLQLAATFNLVFPEITSMSTDFVQLPLASAIQLMSQLDAPQLTSLHLDGSSFNSTVTATRSDKVHKALKELTLNNYQCTIQQIMNFFSQVQMPHLQSLRITNTKLVFSPLSDSNLPNVKLRELVDITVEKFTSTMHNLLLMLKKINSSEVKKVTVSHFRTVSFKLDWHKDITHFSQLLDLNVDHVRCTLDELIHLLGVMRVPKLQSATLIHIHMLSNENEQNTRNIDMPSVAKFVIDHIQCSMPQLLNLLSRLHAPELLKLELCNIQLSSTSFQESGVKGFKKKTQNFVTFAKLTSLYIRFSSYASCEQVMMLFMKLNMPKLVELRLEFAVMRSKDSHAHSSDNYKSVKAITLPNLRTLQFDGNKQQLWCLRKKINTPALKEYSVLGTVYSDEYLVPISM